MVSWLISKGALVNMLNNAQCTPLHTAAQNGQQVLAEILLRAGANVNAQDADGQTPRAIALDRGHPHIARLLEASAGKAREVVLKWATPVA